MNHETKGTSLISISLLIYSYQQYANCIYLPFMVNEKGKKSLQMCFSSATGTVWCLDFTWSDKRDSGHSVGNSSSLAVASEKIKRKETF